MLITQNSNLSKQNVEYQKEAKFNRKLKGIKMAN